MDRSLGFRIREMGVSRQHPRVARRLPLARTDDSPYSLTRTAVRPHLVSAALAALGHRLGESSEPGRDGAGDQDPPVLAYFCGWPAERGPGAHAVLSSCCVLGTYSSHVTTLCGCPSPQESRGPGMGWADKPVPVRGEPRGGAGEGEDSRTPALFFFLGTQNS